MKRVTIGALNQTMPIVPETPRVFSDWQSYFRICCLVTLFIGLTTKSFCQINPGHAGAIVHGSGAIPYLDGALSVFVSENYAYVASRESNALEIVDITNPAAPVHKGSLIHGTGGARLDEPSSVYVSGNYAYVASRSSDALEIIDISNPSIPMHAGSLAHGTGGALLDGAKSVYVSGNYAYVASSPGDALEIIDISIPSAPVHAGSLAHGTGGALLDGANSVYVSGNYAYVASLNSDALEIIDISNPSAPVHAGSLAHGTGGALLDGANSVYVSGNYAYVASVNSDALEIIHIIDPLAPVHAGSLTHGTDGALLDYAYSVYVSGNYAYVGSNLSDALEIIDISNPSAPAHAGSLTHGTGGALLDGAGSVYVSGDYAYVASFFSDAVQIVDIRDPLAPMYAGSLVKGTGGALLGLPFSVYVSGNYAYVASRASNALEIVDVSDPSAPAHAVSLTHGTGGALLDWPVSVYVSGEYAYVASWLGDALEIIDVSIPSAPAHAGSLTHGTGGALLDAAISVYVSDDNYAYVASYASDALEIIDVSIPSAPAHAGSLTHGTGGALLDEPHSVYVFENYAYVASYASDALEIINVNIPSAPAHAGSLTHGADGALLDGANSVYVSWPYAYVTSFYSDALEVIDISNPATPEHVGNLTNGTGGALLDGPVSVYVSGNYAYVASQFSNALEIVDITIPSIPKHAGSLINGTGGALLDLPYSVYVSGTYAYVGSFGGNALEIVYFYYPDLASFSPVNAATGASITIHGMNFNTSAEVEFNGTEAFVSSVTNTTLEVAVPDNATIGRISVAVEASPGQAHGYRVISGEDFFVNPTAVPASAIQQTKFTAGWSDVGASEYFVDVSTDNFSTTLSGYDNLSVASATSFEVTGLSPATTYQYRVRASKFGGASGNSNVIDALTVTGTPTATAASSISNTKFIANWNPVSGATGYSIDVATNSAFTSILPGYDDLPVSGTSLDVSGLVGGTNYYYRVRSKNTSGESPDSNEIAVLTKPTTPTLNSIMEPDVGQTSATASWPAVAGIVDDYLLDLSTTDFTQGATLVDGFPQAFTGTGASLTGLDPGTNYWVRIRSRNDSGESPNSNVQTFLTKPANPAVNTPDPADILQISVSIDWSIVNGATDYEVEVSSTDFAQFATLLPEYPLITTEATLNIGVDNGTGTLSPGTVYWIRIRSRNSTGTSGYSNVIQVLTEPTAPTLNEISPSDISQTDADVGWTAVTGAADYLVEVSSTDFTEATTLLAGFPLTATGVSATIGSGTPLGAGAEYWVRIQARNGSGTSPYSNILALITKPATPTLMAPSIVDIGQTSALISWEAATGIVDGYRLDVSDDGFQTFLSGYNSKVVSETMKEVEGLSEGTEYEVRIRSENASGESPNSNAVDLLTIPANPTATSATSETQNSFVANWDAVTGASYYIIEVSLDNFASLISKDTVSGQIFLELGELNSGSSYKYRVQSGNATGISGFSNEITANTTTVAPQVSVDPIDDQLYSLGIAELVIPIETSGGVGTVTVVVRHSNILEDTFGPDLTLTQDANGDYPFTITSDMLDELGLRFEVEATDGQGSDVEAARVLIGFDAATSPAIPFENFGGTKNDWNMFSIPYQLVNSSVQNVFENYNPSDHPFDWKVVRYQNNINQYADHLTGQIELGKGYWFNAKDRQSVKLGAGQVTPNIPFSLILLNGWNLIGNPYPVDISWTNVLADNPGASGVGDLQVFSGQNQSTATNLSVFGAAFVWADQPTTLSINPATVNAGGRTGPVSNPSVSYYTDDSQWQLIFSLASNGEVLQLGGLGMHPAALESKDPFDKMSIPRFFFYTDLSTEHSEYFFPWFATDVVPPAHNHTWSFTLESNVHSLSTLKWDQSLIEENVFQLLLFDKARGRFVDMRTVGSYGVDLSQGPFEFEIHYLADPNAELLISELILGDAYPNPATRLTTIPVSIPTELDEYSIDLSVYDLNGRKVSTVTQGVFGSGYYEFEWKLDPRFRRGLYFYRLAIDDKVLTKKLLVK